VLVVALCKAAVLIATLETSVQVIEPSAGAEECEKVDMASPLLGGGARVISLGQSPVRNVRKRLGAERACRRANAATVARVAGHRLANGLCAPLRC
jgi:hypothetical protein